MGIQNYCASTGCRLCKNGEKFFAGMFDAQYFKAQYGRWCSDGVTVMNAFFV
jgi:hypothetical protein